MATLQQFGHGAMGGGGADALGDRPLVAVLANMMGVNGQFVHGAMDHTEHLFGSAFGYNNAGNQYYRRNVRDFYSEMSCDRFTWKATSPAVAGPLTLSSADAALDLRARRPRIVALARDSGSFDFRPYDLSNDCTVTSSELNVLIVDNASNSGGQADANAPALGLGCATTPSGNLGTLVVGQRGSITLMAHELLHLLGAHDVYGPWQPSVGLNWRCSLMGGNEGDDGTAAWHLDPWHKMRLGWADPLIFDLTGPIPPLELVAPGAKDPRGAAILYSPQKGFHEYFMVEFRNPGQRSGRYDGDVASRGIAIWHVVTQNDHSLKEYAWPVTNSNARMLWTEAVPDPATGVTPRFGQSDQDFQRGGNTLWDRGRMTPPLRWIDGTPAWFRLCVRNYVDDSDTAIVDVIPADLRRQTSGGRLVQSTWGRAGNYELLISSGSRLVHAWRDNDDPSFAWHSGGSMSFGGSSDGPVAGIVQTVRGASLLASTIRGNGTIGDLEAVVWLEKPNGESHLSLVTFDSARRAWGAAVPIVADGTPVSDVTGLPALVQSDFGNYGNAELLVPHGGTIVHYWRANDEPGRPWHRGSAIGFGGRPGALAQRPTAVALLQSSIKGDGTHGNFDAVTYIPSALAGDGHLSFFAWDSSSRQWSTPRTITVDGIALRVTGAPGFMQSDFGEAGNYEMLVPEGTRLAHYWRDNDDGAYPWRRGAVIEFGGSTADQVAQVAQYPVGVSLLRSKFKGDGVRGNFDGVVRLHSVASNDDAVAFVAYDTGTRQWTRPVGIVADGQPLRER